MPDEPIPEGAIHLDPAVDAAKRTVAKLNNGLKLDRELNDDIITMAVVILRISGHQIVDKT